MAIFEEGARHLLTGFIFFSCITVGNCRLNHRDPTVTATGMSPVATPRMLGEAEENAARRARIASLVANQKHMWWPRTHPKSPARRGSQERQSLA